MKRKLLSLLASIAIVVALFIPFATPVMAGVVTVTLVTPAQGYAGQTLLSAVIDGSGFVVGSDTNTVTFTNLSITASNVQCSSTNQLVADISIDGNAVPGTTSVRVTNTNGNSGDVAGLFQIGTFSSGYPRPTDGNTGSVAVSITPYIGGTLQTVNGVQYTLGGSPTTGPVYEGEKITYHVNLSMPNFVYPEVGYNFFGGTLAVRLPNSSTTYILVAGPGSLAMPAIPEISKYISMNFSLPATLDYTVSHSDLVDLGSGKRLYAYVDYGIPDYPAIDGGVSGTYEAKNGLLVGAHAGSDNELTELGSLQVTKDVVVSGAPGSGTGVTKDFSVTVTGPSPSTDVVGTHTFHCVDGSIVPSSGYENPWTVSTQLVPGLYTVTEDPPGSNWTAIGYSTSGGVITVDQGETANETITNTLIPGNLVVTKYINWNNLDPSLRSGISQDFSVKVSGPSYPLPDGIIHTFRLHLGQLQDISGYENPWSLNNIMPGDYDVEETTPGGNWTIASGNGHVNVDPGQTPATRDITNAYASGNLTITKVVHTNGADPNAIGLDGSFTVTVTKSGGTPSYNHTFNMTDGSIVPSYQHENPWNLTGLPLGDYNVTETGLNITNPTYWTVNVSGNTTVGANSNNTVTVTNDYIPHPATQLSLGFDVPSIPPDGHVTVTLTEHNSGDSPINNVSIDLNINPSNPAAGTYTKSSPEFYSSSINGDAILDMGETWTWHIPVTLTQDTTFTAIGHGTFSGQDVADEYANNGIYIPHVPGFSDMGLGLLIGGLVILIPLLAWRRSRTSRS